jgi:hypothetical protein
MWSWESDWPGRGAQRSRWSRFRQDCHELARAPDMTRGGEKFAQFEFVFEFANIRREFEIAI